MQFESRSHLTPTAFLSFDSDSPPLLLTPPSSPPLCSLALSKGILQNNSLRQEFEESRRRYLTEIQEAKETNLRSGPLPSLPPLIDGSPGCKTRSKILKD
jgi:hypothetical protein